jgi:hypothetical protein
MTPASTQEAGPAAESKSSKLVEPGALWSSNSSWVSIRPTTTGLILLSFVLHLGLLLYANHVDSHPERFGGLTYTDVDWSVVSDGAVLIVRGGDDASTRAKGWLVRLSGWRIGE